MHLLASLLLLPLLPWVRLQPRQPASLLLALLPPALLPTQLHLVGWRASPLLVLRVLLIVPVLLLLLLLLVLQAVHCLLPLLAPAGSLPPAAPAAPVCGAALPAAGPFSAPAASLSAPVCEPGVPLALPLPPLLASVAPPQPARAPAPALRGCVLRLRRQVLQLQRLHQALPQQRPAQQRHLALVCPLLLRPRRRQAPRTGAAAWRQLGPLAAAPSQPG
jgi:hypothetical protein